MQCVHLRSPTAEPAVSMMCPWQDVQGLIRRFTSDLDRTVQKQSFVHDFNELYNKTATAQVADSTQMYKLLCPREVARHQQKLHKGTNYAAGQVTMRTNRDIQRGEGAKVGPDHTRWSRYGSRKEMLKARRLSHRQEAAAKTEKFLSTFPAPGNVRETFPGDHSLTGPPGVRPAHHHQIGRHAPFL